jgi:hypothetical protein
MSAKNDMPLRYPVPPVLVIPEDREQEEKDAPGKPDSASQLVLGFIFGIVFGFLLQKGALRNTKSSWANSFSPTSP